MTLVTFEHVAAGYGGRPILPPVDLKLDSGARLGIVGPNGSGKTTLVKTLIGLLRPAAGRVLYPEGRPAVGYVPQRDRVNVGFPLSTREVVRMGRFSLVGVGRRLRPEDERLADECLARVGLGDLGARPFGALSGGQRQRALMARALCAQPKLLVLDEPTAGMDLAGEESILEIIDSIGGEQGMAVVMVSHQLSLVAAHVRELLIVDKEQKRIEIGPTERILTSERLTTLYGVPVSVVDINGRKAIFASRELAAHTKAPADPGSEKAS